jgi:transposase InsO family protein
LGSVILDEFPEVANASKVLPPSSHGVEHYIAAASCADALIAGWISRYGVPAQLTSDRGTQFTSAIWDAMCQRLGIQHQPTPAFHPQANCMVERCHYISTKGPPIASKFRRLDTEKLQAAKAEFEQLEREGIMQRSTSPWASPLHMVM